MRLLNFLRLEKGRKTSKAGQTDDGNFDGVITSIGETRQERPKLQSRDSNPDEPPKRLRGVPEGHEMGSWDTEHEAPVELLSLYDKETERAVDVLRKLNLPVDAECLVPHRPSNVGSWDWTFPDNVHRVSLCDSQLGDELASALATVLKPRKNESGTWSFPHSIKTLALSNSGIRGAGAVALAHLLEPQIGAHGEWAYNDGLAKLDLSDNCIGDEGVEALASALMPRQASNGEWCSNQALRELWLGGNRISTGGLEQLLRALIPADSSRPPSKLEALGLGRNAFGDDGAEVLAEILTPLLQADGTWAYPYALKSINIWGNCITDDGALSLLEALKPCENKDGSLAFNKTIENITMFRNAVSGPVKAQLQEVVKAVNDCRGEDAPSMVLMC